MTTYHNQLKEKGLPFFDIESFIEAVLQYMENEVRKCLVNKLALAEVDVVPSPAISDRNELASDTNQQVESSTTLMELLTEKLGDQENEIENLKRENSTLQDNQMKLRIQYDDEKKQYETEYAFMLDEKDRHIQHISEDKDKQIKDLADEKEKLTDLINSNNTSISRQQQEELNRKINTNLMSLKEYQLKLAACENDIRIQNIQFLECQQALQKCNYDKQSDQEEYNKLLISQNHYVQECQQKLLDCENSKQIKYDEYNTLVKNINEANKYNIETLERLYTKPTLSNSDIIHCFSSIFPLDDDNESKETRKSQIEAIINKFIHQLNTERDNYIHEEREKDIRDRISRLNYYINNIESLQNNDLLNIFTNEEERNLFNQILAKFKTNIIDETVYEHERQIIPYVNENDHLKRQLDEPNYVAKLLIDAVTSIVLVKEIITKRIVDLEKDHKGTNEEVIKVYAFVTILYTLFQKEIRQDLNANNVQRFYYIILNMILSIDNEKKNLKSIALLHEANMEAEKWWFLKNLKVKYESVLGDDSILKAIASQKVSSPETVEKTTKSKRDKTNLKDAKQRTKDKTQGRRQVEALTEKKNLKDRHINTIRGGIVENK
ncbi:putative leucine-rich repeat-containing protein DDB_G0290503 [Procambarus clarkii]|uniref:putative leucine-rich repeat-containing protein DDB_G0290503 n=1 Tax=Procambarus clarkii TaxID=6728 RepID=UPI003744074F